MKTAGWWLLLLATIALPFAAGEYYINFASQIFIAVIFAASLNLLVGYGGLPALRPAAFLGVSAYLSAWFYLKFGLGHWIIAPVALVATTVMAGLFGLI